MPCSSAKRSNPVIRNSKECFFNASSIFYSIQFISMYNMKLIRAAIRDISLICFLLVSLSGQAQRPTNEAVLAKFGFREIAAVTGNDTVYFYYRAVDDRAPDRLVLYLQGSSADPLFSVAQEKKEYKSYRWFPGDYKMLDERYAYAVIAKKGLHGVPDEKNLSVPNSYHEHNSLDYRVFQARETIKYILQNLMENPKKVIVYGHSEGAPVAARLAATSSVITHLGFWAGHVLSEFYDLIILNGQAAKSGQISMEEHEQYVSDLLEDFKNVKKDSLSTKVEGGYTSKRWWSYSEPVFNDLIQIDIPLFVQVATHDKSSPIESTYQLPLEFIRLGKTNLSFNICAGCDHGFVRKNRKKEEPQWANIFQEFINWTEVQD